MIELTGTKKEQRVRTWLNENMDGRVPANYKVVDIFRKFQTDCPDLSYGLLNCTLKKVVEEGHVSTVTPIDGDSVVNDTPIDAKIVNIEDMDFPDFKLHKSGKKIDTLMSDHEEGGGTYGGTANIVIGESGVGKSTVLLDLLASIKAENPDARMLYISSEMTRNDLYFYYKKTPSIATVPTLLLMDYVKTGKLDRILKQTFNDGYDIIILDSYQDIIVKLKEVHGWKSTFAESWLTNMMIDAAEKQGAAVFAIQHMTKGGQYVGSTYLKHATTAMLEMYFDDAGQRYLTFSKNRRGGSMVNKRLYFNLDKNGNVIYDDERFNETEELRDIEKTETIRQADLSRMFDETFLKKPINNDSVVNTELGDDVPELVLPETLTPTLEEEE